MLHVFIFVAIRFSGKINRSHFDEQDSRKWFARQRPYLEKSFFEHAETNKDGQHSRAKSTTSASTYLHRNVKPANNTSFVRRDRGSWELTTISHVLLVTAGETRYMKHTPRGCRQWEGPDDW